MQEYVFYVMNPQRKTVLDNGAAVRLEQVAKESGAAMVYSDYREIASDGVLRSHPLNGYTAGGVRDDFDFGTVVLVRKNLLENWRSEHGAAYDLVTVAEDGLVNLGKTNMQTGIGAIMAVGNNYHMANYSLRLYLSRCGGIRHIAEELYTVSDSMAVSASECAVQETLPVYESQQSERECIGQKRECVRKQDKEAQFDYVDPKNRAVQIEMERIFTEHLKEIGAWLPERTELLPAEVFTTVCSHSDGDSRDSRPLLSVIIPVYNRVATVADAIASALLQETDFSYNIIVVDNYSTDGTAEKIQAAAEYVQSLMSRVPWYNGSAENIASLNASEAGQPCGTGKVLRVVPCEKGHGIGGCWNIALNHPLCGTFAVQLDSDDMYSGPDTLQKIMDKFRQERCAMLVGSYMMTDFNLNPIPPGVIDHREWTDANGHNNLLRVNGLGAPRAFYVPALKEVGGFEDVSYGEDYGVGLRISRRWHIGRIFEPLYFCRRWGGNSDSALPLERINANNTYKDSLRAAEIEVRSRM